MKTDDDSGTILLYICVVGFSIALAVVEARHEKEVKRLKRKLRRCQAKAAA